MKFPDEMKVMAEAVAEYMVMAGTDDRGLFMKCISEELRKKSQHYTSGLFNEIADKYGYEEKP